MTKHQLDYIRDLKRKIAADSAKRTREYKKQEFEKAIAKDKIETYGDLFAVLGKLSKRAKDIAALNKIQTLAGIGYSPVKIIELMEPKKEKKNEKIGL